MSRDDQRPSSRLSPPRPDYEWGAESRSTPSQRGRPQSHHLEWEDDADQAEPSSTRYEEEVVEGDFSFADEPDLPPVFKSRRAGARQNAGSHDSTYEDPPVREARTEVASRPAAVAGTPLVFKGAVLGDMPEGTQELSVQERHQLLIHMIELYDDLWKLAGIRANEKKDRLEAYLIPRTQRVELKEAISKNLALIITIDSRGNTDIREPKSKSAWRKFTTWLFGS